MATREEIKSIMYVIANEYPNFIPANKEMAKLKINTWENMLKDVDYLKLQQATMQMLSTFEYGTPKIAHLMTILNPPMQNQNLGMEFAVRLIELSAKYGTDKIGDKIVKEFGEVGYSVYRQVKNELRELKTDDSNTFKAQVRNLFNSLKERETYGTLENLPYQNEAQKMINNNLKGIASTMKLNKDN